MPVNSGSVPFEDTLKHYGAAGGQALSESLPAIQHWLPPGASL
jgi:hypothetical protein